MAPNPYLEAGRRRKASALLVQALRDGLALADVALFSDEEWAALAFRAGVRSPSSETRALVVEDLERKEAPTPAGDPFVGLSR